MGALIEAAAFDAGDEVTAVVDPLLAQSPALKQSARGAPFYPDIAAVGPNNDHAIVIDFTHPAVVVDNIRNYAERGFSAVIGTTGWYEKIDMVKEIVAGNGTALLYASNFSLGVSLFYKIAEYAAKLIDAFPDYDVAGYELHHHNKADSPSGTAKTLAEKTLAVMSRKKSVCYDMLNRAPLPDELHFASVRGGAIPGTHTLLFDSSADTIEITHRARNRDGFAGGALAAAHWLAAGGKKGVWTLDAMLEKG
jgi:4-hydroxy-tetrahydrodipicolinate reductase